MSASAVKRGFRTYLIGKSAVTDLVKTAGATSPRIFHLRAPQGAAAPFIVHFLAGSKRDHVTNGADGTPTARFQVQVWGTSETEIDPVVDALFSVLDGYRSTFGDTSWGAGLWVQGSFVVDEKDMVEEPQDGSDKGFIGVALDIDVSYNETVPALMP